MSDGEHTHPKVDHLTVLDYSRAEDALDREANRDDLDGEESYVLNMMSGGLRHPATISTDARERSVQALKEWATSLLTVAHALEQREIP